MQLLGTPSYANKEVVPSIIALGPKVTTKQATTVLNLATTNKIKNALGNMDGNKCPGLDGFFS